MTGIDQQIREILLLLSGLSIGVVLVHFKDTQLSMIIGAIVFLSIVIFKIY